MTCAAHAGQSFVIPYRRWLSEAQPIIGSRRQACFQALQPHASLHWRLLSRQGGILVPSRVRVLSMLHLDTKHKVHEP